MESPRLYELTFLEIANLRTMARDAKTGLASMANSIDWSGPETKGILARDMTDRDRWLRRAMTKLEVAAQVVAEADEFLKRAEEVEKREIGGAV